MACRILIVISLMAAALTAHPTRASDRVALVIGNADYAHVPRLANPLNDAGDMGAALARLGFAVTILENTGYQDMRRGLQEFMRAASGAAMAVVFYAGHGIEVDKRNFLVPVDARFRTDGDIKYEAVPLDLVVDTLEGVTGLRMVILDACRDNPFLADMLVRSTRTIGRGLARVEPSGEMLVVAYAAMGGTVALDGKGRNSPYTAALLAHLEEPGLELGLMFRKVSEAVRKTTGNDQQPVTYDNLPSAGIYLAGLPPLPKPDPAPGPAPGPGDNGGTGPAAQAYEAAERLGTPEAFEAFAKHYEDSVYAALARGQIARLTDPEANGGTGPAAQAYEAAKQLGTPEAFEAFAKHYEDSFYAALARGQIARLTDPEANGGTGPAAQAYEAAERLGTPEAFEAFAKHYEDSVYAALARGQIARLTDPEAVETALGLETDNYALVQLALDAAAFRLGRIDGKFGPKSRGALKRWQASKGYPATGFLTGKQLADLREKGQDIEARDREARDKAREARDKARARAEAEGAARGRILLDRHGTRAMHEAARNGHVDAMRWLQAQGADVNARNNGGRTPMHEAAWKGHVDAMRWLQAQGADVNARTDVGDTPMHWAAVGGHVDAMRWLQAQGADVNARRRNSGSTPMHRAAGSGQVDAMRWLQAQGVDVNARDNYGSTPMHRAAYFGHVDAMRWLQAQGADVNARRNNGSTPMHDAVLNGGHVDAMRWLQAQGADVNARSNDGRTPMHWAAYYGHVDPMRWLQAQGADVNARDKKYGQTPLGAAERGGETKAANWLRANGGRK